MALSARSDTGRAGAPLAAQPALGEGSAPRPARGSLRALAERVRQLRGWRRRTAALAAGAASALAMAPLFAWPVLWLTLPVLVWLIDGAPPGDGSANRGAGRLAALRHAGQAAASGWWFGFGYF